MTGGFIKIAPSIGSECGGDLARLNPLKANTGAGKAGIHPCDISKAIPGRAGMENAQFSAITPLDTIIRNCYATRMDRFHFPSLSTRPSSTVNLTRLTSRVFFVLSSVEII